MATGDARVSVRLLALALVIGRVLGQACDAWSLSHMVCHENTNGSVTLTAQAGNYNARAKTLGLVTQIEFTKIHHNGGNWGLDKATFGWGLGGVDFYQASWWGNGQYFANDPFDTAHRSWSGLTSSDVLSMEIVGNMVMYKRNGLLLTQADASGYSAMYARVNPWVIHLGVKVRVVPVPTPMPTKSPTRNPANEIADDDANEIADGDANSIANIDANASANKIANDDSNVVANEGMC
jgi:hypothetical protein